MPKRFKRYEHLMKCKRFREVKYNFT
jgi:hypothetical protein